MTKKDYEYFAAAVRAMRQTRCFGDMRTRLGETSYDNVLETIIDQIAIACVAGGPRFDYDKFTAACRKGEY